MIELDIRHPLARLSLSDTVLILDRRGEKPCRSTVHNEMQKADLQALDGANPGHVAVDETAIQLNDKWFWLYVAIDPYTNRLLHFKPSPKRNQAITEMFLSELREKHLVDGAIVLVDPASRLQSALHRHDFDYRYKKHGNRFSIERFFRELKRGTNQFSNCFCHAEADTIENWLQAYCLRMEPAYPNTTTMDG